MPTGRPLRRFSAAARPGRRCRARALVLLGGYVFALAGTPAGHGWALLGHLLGAHAVAPIPAYRHDFRPLGHAHTHGDAHGHAPLDAHADAKPHADPPEAPPAADPSGAHRHGGVTHTHTGAAEAPAPALVSLDLAKHCLAERTVVPLAATATCPGCARATGPTTSS